MLPIHVAKTELPNFSFPGSHAFSYFLFIVDIKNFVRNNGAILISLVASLFTSVFFNFGERFLCFVVVVKVFVGVDNRRLGCRIRTGFFLQTFLTMISYGRCRIQSQRSRVSSIGCHVSLDCYTNLDHQRSLRYVIFT